MTTEELAALIRDNDSHGQRRHEELRRELGDVRSCVARLEERTQQHDRRLDRAERRAAGLGAIAGAVSAGIAAAWHFFGGR